MDRAINANSLKTEIEKLQTYKIHENLEKLIPLQEVLDAIREAPTVDAETMMHGRWTTHFGCFPLQCTVCGYEPQQLDFEYCPGCGAKMDIEAN